jgi:hypothetical protein
MHKYLALTDSLYSVQTIVNPQCVPSVDLFHLFYYKPAHTTATRTHPPY